jgi:hypothetical protein
MTAAFNRKFGIGRWRRKTRMKHRIFAFLVLLLALAGAARAATTTWAATTYGPYKKWTGGEFV